MATEATFLIASPGSLSCEHSNAGIYYIFRNILTVFMFFSIYQENCDICLGVNDRYLVTLISKLFTVMLKTVQWQYKILLMINAHMLASEIIH
jgi:hypothetical protein